jgi:hypothetical protein
VVHARPARSSTLAAWIAVVLTAGVVALPSQSGSPRQVVTPSAAERSGAVTTSSTTIASTTVPAPAPPTTTSTIPRRRPSTEGRTVTTMPDLGPGPHAGGIPLPAGTYTSGPVDLEGTVRDAAGRPVSGACVEVYMGPTVPWLLQHRGTTAADGRYRAELQMATESEDMNVLVKDCTVSPARFAETLVVKRGAPMEVYTVDVPVVPGAIVSGVIVDDDGHRIDGTGLCVKVSGRANTVDVLVAADGTFVSAAIPPTVIGGFAVQEGCDVGGTSYPYTQTVLGELRSGESYQRTVTIPHGPRSRP